VVVIVFILTFAFEAMGLPVMVTRRVGGGRKAVVVLMIANRRTKNLGAPILFIFFVIIISMSLLLRLPATGDQIKTVCAVIKPHLLHHVLFAHICCIYMYKKANGGSRPPPFAKGRPTLKQLERFIICTLSNIHYFLNLLTMGG